ncbi:MAG: ribonuclease HI [Hydrogenophilales bacterium CG17_big_fil_post_rev_8_21_14_2_50_63_12]|nr:MAG: ribonuclease HI [Hydrogenophilales bacterium CG17_big_fil_post_rev_8_21_14_2_50_63_12]PIX96401.1 MAG: ribonuclease HI [Hydrogenophilales bacterium CG_4_10_14_3_um_filter_63_21]PJB03168.1 MAG: ribonuclease HI [Hydrogenophilales bacterium CG_4_9_14_3_um_filter_63_34]
MADEKIVEMFSDGACKGNPGVGGWGVLLRFGEVEKALCGGARATTNNRMELQAVIEGLKALNRACRVRVHTDSKYVQQGISEWLPNWIRRGWKTAAGGAVKNQDLWRELAEQAALHRVEWRWVKGHAGHPENERADALANEGVRLALKGKN